MSVEKVLEVMLDEATGVDDDSNLLWDADFTEGFMKGTSTATQLPYLCFQLSGLWKFGDIVWLSTLQLAEITAEIFSRSPLECARRWL